MTLNLLVTDDATTICGLLAQQPFVSHAEVDTTDPNRVLLIYTNGERRVLDVSVPVVGHQIASDWEEEEDASTGYSVLEYEEGIQKAIDHTLAACEQAIANVMPLPDADEILRALPIP